MRLLGLLALIGGTLLWGTSFVVVQGAIAHVPPSVVTLVRFSIAALCFAPFLKGDRRLVGIGLELGLWIVGGYTTQAIGLIYTNVNRSAFITSLYVLGIPILFWLLGRSVSRVFWIGAGLALVGVGLLSYDGTPPNLGDLWTLGTALCYTVYIWRLEVHTPSFNALTLTAAQLLGTTAIALLWVMLGQTEWLLPSHWPDLPWRSLVYLGIFTTALTTVLQTWGQRFVGASQASIVYTLEPVWASMFAFVVINERLGIQGILGAAAILSATLLCQLAGQSDRP
ncbi:MAG: EamA/RhaT family transporter [Leptolyngbya sp. DLM2.Bin15]|nr:MAG: EamA/RhaT family transporter [Leptolyngbya sp. DLM2.Bin15]